MADSILMTTTAWLFFCFIYIFSLSFFSTELCLSVCAWINPSKSANRQIFRLIKTSYCQCSSSEDKKNRVHLACWFSHFADCRTVVQLFSCAMTLLWHDTHWFRANMVMTEEVRSGQRLLNMFTSHSRLSQVLPKLRSGSIILQLEYSFAQQRMLFRMLNALPVMTK